MASLGFDQTTRLIGMLGQLVIRGRFITVPDSLPKDPPLVRTEILLYGRAHDEHGNQHFGEVSYTHTDLGRTYSFPDLTIRQIGDCQGKDWQTELVKVSEGWTKFSSHWFSTNQVVFADMRGRSNRMIAPASFDVLLQLVRMHERVAKTTETSDRHGWFLSEGVVYRLEQLIHSLRRPWRDVGLSACVEVPEQTTV